MGSNQTAFFAGDTPGGDDYTNIQRPDNILESHADYIENNLDIDIMTYHFISEFYKIQRKVKKICDHWEAASVIGDLAEIPVHVFERMMNDVLCCFLIHRANNNGITASSGLMDYQNVNG